MAQRPLTTLIEVLEKLQDKLDEAEDFLSEMELYKADRKRFRHRLSAYLTATDSVIDIIGTQGKRYARQINQNALFENWYESKELLFKAPNGSDKSWMYLRAARNDTVHAKQVNPNHLARHDISTCVGITDGLEAIEHHRDGITKVIESTPEPLPPSEPDKVRIETDLWAFQPILDTRTITNIHEHEVPLQTTGGIPRNTSERCSSYPPFGTI